MRQQEEDAPHGCLEAVSFTCSLRMHLAMVTQNLPDMDFIHLSSVLDVCV
jgi:hypothetical protein